MQNPPHKKAKYLDHNFWRIPATVARELSGGRLPRHGKEKAALYQGKSYWIARTVHQGKQIWTMREAAIPFRENSPRTRSPDILAVEKRNGQTYSYIILPEIMEEPKRDGWRVHMNLNDGPFDTAGQGWHLSRDRALERLGTNLAGASYYEKVDVTIYSSELDRYFKEEITRLAEFGETEKRRRVEEEGERLAYQERTVNLREEIKTHRWRKIANFRIAVRGGTKTVPAWTVEGSGIAIHRELGYASGKPGKGYGITHEQSGFKVAGDFPSLETAKIAMTRLINQFDWNLAKKDILKTSKERGEFVRKIQKDVFANPPANPLTVRESGTFKRGAYHQYYIVYSDGRMIHSKERYGTIVQAGKALAERLKVPYDYDKNPPLPSFALQEIAVARSIVREVIEEKRPVTDLQKAVDMMQSGMDEIFESHKGHISPNPPPEHKIPAEIYRNIIEIRAKKKDGKLYRHPFGPGAGIYGLSDGSILIKSRRGKRLWQNFPKGRK